MVSFSLSVCINFLLFIYSNPSTPFAPPSLHSSRFPAEILSASLWLTFEASLACVRSLLLIGYAYVRMQISHSTCIYIIYICIHYVSRYFLGCFCLFRTQAGISGYKGNYIWAVVMTRWVLCLGLKICLIDISVVALNWWAVVCVVQRHYSIISILWYITKRAVYTRSHKTHTAQ